MQTAIPYRIDYVRVGSLLPHEKTQEGGVDTILDIFEDKRLVNDLIIADEITKTILDGHHRTEAVMNKYGPKARIPVILVNYLDERIFVLPKPCVFEGSYEMQGSVAVPKRYGNEGVDSFVKSIVTSRAKAGELFDYKSTKHYVIDRNGSIAHISESVPKHRWGMINGNGYYETDVSKILAVNGDIL